MNAVFEPIKVLLVIFMVIFLLVVLSEYTELKANHENLLNAVKSLRNSQHHALSALEIMAEEQGTLRSAYLRLKDDVLLDHSTAEIHFNKIEDLGRDLELIKERLQSISTENSPD